MAKESLVEFGSDGSHFTMHVHRKKMAMSLEDAQGLHEAMGKGIEMYVDSLLHPEKSK